MLKNHNIDVKKLLLNLTKTNTLVTFTTSSVTMRFGAVGVKTWIKKNRNKSCLYGFVYKNKKKVKNKNSIIRDLFLLFIVFYFVYGLGLVGENALIRRVFQRLPQEYLSEADRIGNTMLLLRTNQFTIGEICLAHVYLGGDIQKNIQTLAYIMSLDGFRRFNVPIDYRPLINSKDPMDKHFMDNLQNIRGSDFTRFDEILGQYEVQKSLPKGTIIVPMTPESAANLRKISLFVDKTGNVNFDAAVIHTNWCDSLEGVFALDNKRISGGLNHHMYIRMFEDNERYTKLKSFHEAQIHHIKNCIKSGKIDLNLGKEYVTELEQNLNYLIRTHDITNCMRNWNSHFFLFRPIFEKLNIGINFVGCVNVHELNIREELRYKYSDIVTNIRERSTTYNYIIYKHCQSRGASREALYKIAKDMADHIINNEP